MGVTGSSAAPGLRRQFPKMKISMCTLFTIGGNEVIPMNNRNRQDLRGPLKERLFEKRLKGPSLEERLSETPIFVRTGS